MKQTISSKDTSIKTINRVYKNLDELGLKENSVIFDYGCGKYDDMKELAESKGYKWFGFDKYNRNDEYNTNSITEMESNAPDLIINSNVLNVIKEDEAMEEVVRNITYYADENSLIIFTVYEGDKTGVGKETSKGYQRNQRTYVYCDIIEKYLTITKKKGNMVYCKLK